MHTPTIESEEQCYHELTGNHLHFSRVAIEYEAGMLAVSVYDHESQQFVHCLTQHFELDYDGFFVISASSGNALPQYTYVNSFELYDPIVVSSSHHF